MNQAACKGRDIRSFYPERGGSTAEARSACRQCPVLDACLEYALEHDERFGIWGGTSEKEREKARRKRQRAARSRNGERVA
jgi:WhiB family redox-sensing transcriptional regulator